VSRPTPPADFLRCNHTELMQVCRNARIPFSPGWSRAQLLAAICGEEFSDSHNPIDNLRDGIMAFVIDYQADVKSQLTCPARTLEPRACYGCVDAKPLLCLLSERAEVQNLIQVRRKPAPSPTPNTSKEDETMAPTARPFSSLEDLKQQKRWELLGHLTAVTGGDPEAQSLASTLEAADLATLVWERYLLTNKGPVAPPPPVDLPPVVEPEVLPADAPLETLGPVPAAPPAEGKGKHSRKKTEPTGLPTAAPSPAAAPAAASGVDAERIANMEKNLSFLLKHVTELKTEEAVFMADVKATLRRVEDNVKASNENFRDLFPKIEVLYEVLYAVASVSLAAAELASDLSPSMLLGHAAHLKDLVRRHMTGKVEELATQEVGPESAYPHGAEDAHPHPEPYGLGQGGLGEPLF
jgi:hypothetical protein